MKGRVLILTGELPNRPGGVEHFVRDLERVLTERGYSAEVFHRGNSAPGWLTTRKGRISQYVANNLLGYYLGRSARKTMGPDVVALISNGDLGWCSPAPIHPDGKRIHMYHGTYRGQAEAIRPFISRRGYLYLKWWNSGVLERLGGRRRTVLCNSEQTQQEVARFFGYNGAVVWLPLDTALFRPRDAKQCRIALGLDRGMKIGLFVGSTAPAKGFGIVRRLIDAVSDVYWILAFNGQVPPDLENNARVRLLRDVTVERLPDIYGAADFMVCPSYYESFGYVVAESLACGTPVISSPTGASRLFLCEPPLDRLLVEHPDDIRGFRRAVTEVLSSPEYYRERVLSRVGPKLHAIMSPESWWGRVSEATGL